MTNEQRAETYRKGITCIECINYHECKNEMNPNLRRIYGHTCTKILTKTFESGAVDALISGVDQAIDWNLDISDDEKRIYKGYRRVFTNSGQTIYEKLEEKQFFWRDKKMEQLTQSKDCPAAGQEDVLAKLAAYEDTGLTPEQIREIDKLYSEQAKELHDLKTWILCSERLPENDEIVLVQVSGRPRKNIVLEYALQLAAYESGEWSIDEYPEWDTPDVICWRPLPEPYRPDHKIKGMNFMNNTSLECSLGSTMAMRNLILENPELPLLVFVNEYAYSGEYSYNQADVSNVEIVSLTLYKECWVDKDEYKEQLINDLSDEDEYKNLSDLDYLKIIHKKIEDTEFVKAIVIYVG